MSITTARVRKPTTLPRSVDGSTGEWTRPSAWLSLPSVAGEQKFAGLYLIAKDGNFVALSAAGDYTVDWGDGTSTNHATGTTAYKEYDYDDIASTGESELGYRQVVIAVTPQAGQNLTSLSLQHRHNQTGLNTGYSPLWLDIDINGSNLTTLTIGGSISLSALQQATIRDHAITSAASLFQNCRSLLRVPLFNTAAVTDMSSMFRSCSSLSTVPLFNTSSATTMSFMFTSCSSLSTVPLFNTSSVTTMGNMFQNCSSLSTVPLFNTSSVTDMGSMLSGCFSLTSVPLFNTAAVTNMGNMFQNCYRLSTVPLFNTSSVTTMGNMLSGCFSLTSVPLFNTAAVTNMSGVFTNCTSLSTVPLFSTSSVTTMGSMFAGCSILSTVPLFNTSSVTTMGSMLSGCSSLTSVPALNANAATTLGTVASGGNISWFDVTNINATITFASQKLSKAALDHIFTNLLRRTVSTTITISGNYGADTAVSKTSCGTTANSKVVTQANTANLAVGMRVLGVGVNDAVAVTFQDSGDTVTRNSHGLSDGTIVSFTSITSTTGILTYTQYYVVNATTNTFQVAATSGGAAIALATDGSGNMLYPAYITAITTDTSFEMSAPASATGTVTLTARILDTFPAIAKGWSVSG
jgi:surface protein